MTDIIKRTGFRNGLFLGLFLILLSSYIYFENIAWVTNVWAGVLTLVITILLGITSIVSLKSKLGGFITFKEAFSVYFFTILTGGLLSALFLLVLFSFILSSETKTMVIQGMLEFDINLLKQNLMPQKNIDDTIEVYKTLDPFSPQKVFTGFVGYLLRDCLIGFLVALIFRNKRTL